MLTHGEPHPGNIIRSPAGPRLIDWDTVQIAPPERDLWMLTTALADLLGEEPACDDDQALARYTRLTGRTATPTGIALYRLWWTPADIAVFVDELRRPHGTGQDVTAALTYLTGCLESGRNHHQRQRPTAGVPADVLDRISTQTWTAAWTKAE
ncbi:phosphotransferase [Streptomyces sp. NPDC047043]|uniref:phosphotransferase n=1 Tax=Streptomyces sp. NPDC047043 TaxID=3154497 RepID=UPI0033C80311